MESYILFNFDDTSLIFEWNQSKTVNVYYKEQYFNEEKNCLDCFSFGYTKQTDPTFQEAKKHIEEYIKENDITC